MAGKTFQDRELAARVRSLALEEIEVVLKEKNDKELYKAILVKLAGTILPRLNEVSGVDGKPIPISNVFINDISDNDSNEEDSKAPKED